MSDTNSNIHKDVVDTKETNAEKDQEKDHNIDNNPEDIEDPQDENGSVLVIILQCESRSCDQNITNLKWVFSDPFFTVQVCQVDLPPNVPVTKTLTQSQYQENYCIRKALTYAAEGPYLVNQDGTITPQFWWTKLPVIIVKDSSIANISPSGNTDFTSSDSADNIIGGMKRRISVALNRARQADLFYLCKWNDLCNKYTDVNGVNSVDHGSTLKWSVQPTATQAIMYTSSSRDYVRETLVDATVPLGELLNNDISQGNLLAVVFVPNIISYDVTLATNTTDYLKLNECEPVSGTGTTSSTQNFAWFIVIVIAVLLVALALIIVGPRYTSNVS